MKNRENSLKIDFSASIVKDNRQNSYRAIQNS